MMPSEGTAKAGPSSTSRKEDAQETSSPILGGQRRGDKRQETQGTEKKRCRGCNANLSKQANTRVKLIATQEDVDFYSASVGVDLALGDLLCSKCRLTRYRAKSSQRTAEAEPPQAEPQPPQAEPQLRQDAADPKLSQTVAHQPDAPKEGEPQVEHEHFLSPLPQDFGQPSTSADNISEVALGEDQKRNEVNCVGCNFPLRKSSGRTKTITDPGVAEIYTRNLETAVFLGDVLCNKCRQKPYTKNTGAGAKVPKVVQLSQSPSPGTGTSSSQGSDSSTNDPSYVALQKQDTGKEERFVEMPFSRVVSSHKYCFVCGSTVDLRVVPSEARQQAYAKRRIFIPKNNRCCRSHLIKNRLFEEDLKKLTVFSTTSFIEINDLKDFVDHFASRSDSTLADKIGDCSFSEKDIKVFTGLNWDQLKELQSLLSSMRNSAVRNVTQALVTFLFKLRTGNSNSIVASVLGLQREQQVSDYCDAVIKAFERDVLPSKFGVSALLRSEIVENQTSTFAKKSLDITDEVVLVFDGTYVHHQKSSNNEYQRRSYSGQKKKPLCKPFTVCTTNGYVVDVFGPYSANLNDAQIMEDVMKTEGGLKTLLKKGDICIVDRGFRDVVDFLRSQGYRVLMPALTGKRNQLTAAEANESRKVTKLRWVVESVHGVVGQKYGFLHHQVDNKMLPKVGSLCRIACFINNMFGKRLESDKDQCDIILTKMRLRDATENSLAREVEEKHLGRRKVPFKEISSSDLTDFPEMTENDLKILFTGSYQLSQSVSYLAEIMDDQNRLILSYLKEMNNILRVNVPSRHIKSKTYKSFIDYQPDSEGFRGIRRYCCDCPNGNRTIGCCAHVAAIIYYLSHARFLSKIVRPAEILSQLLQKEQVTTVINEDSDDD